MDIKGKMSDKFKQFKLLQEEPTEVLLNETKFSQGELQSSHDNQ